MGQTSNFEKNHYSMVIVIILTEVIHCVHKPHGQKFMPPLLFSCVYLHRPLRLGNDRTLFYFCRTELVNFG